MIRTWLASSNRAPWLSGIAGLSLAAIILWTLLGNPEGGRGEGPLRRALEFGDQPRQLTYTERQHAFTYAAGAGLSRSESLRRIQELMPLSEIEQRRLVNLLATYRPADAGDLVEEILEQHPSLSGGYLARWLKKQ